MPHYTWCQVPVVASGEIPNTIQQHTQQFMVTPHSATPSLPIWLAAAIANSLEGVSRVSSISTSE
jgi:hypothetical protein